jgi:hypothetical protein
LEGRDTTEIDTDDREISQCSDAAHAGRLNLFIGLTGANSAIRLEVAAFGWCIETCDLERRRVRKR